MPKDAEGNEIQSEEERAEEEEEKEEEETEEEEKEEKRGEDDISALAGQIKGLQARVTRLAERNEYLEKSLELEEKSKARGRSSEEEEALSQDLQELERAMSPILDKRRKAELGPVLGAIAKTQEQLDAIGFKSFLRGERPDLEEDEGTMDRLNQEIAEVRQSASERGSWLSREEAYYFAEGVRSRQENAANKSKRKKENEKTEKRRKIDSDLSSSEGRSSRRRDSQADMQEILDKARRGQVLTDDEKKKRFEYLKNQQF